jgi:hypothetical protein
MEILGLGPRKARIRRDYPPTEEEQSVSYIDYTVQTASSHTDDSPWYIITQNVNSLTSEAKEQLAKLIGENADLVVREETGSVIGDEFFLAETGIPSNNEVESL